MERFAAFGDCRRIGYDPPAYLPEGLCGENLGQFGPKQANLFPIGHALYLIYAPSVLSNSYGEGIQS